MINNKPSLYICVLYLMIKGDPTIYLCCEKNPKNITSQGTS